MRPFGLERMPERVPERKLAGIVSYACLIEPKRETIDFWIHDVNKAGTRRVEDEMS